MKIAVVFPGQGSQYKDMAIDFLDASKESIDFCERIEDYLSVSVRELLNDSEKVDELSQLRLVIAEILIYLAFKSEIGFLAENLKYAAGHSLGEYSALYVSGVLSITELLNLVLFRNRIIEENQSDSNSTMIAVTGKNISNIANLINSWRITNLFASNINSYKQIVFSGTTSAISELKSNLDKEDIRSVVLNVNKGFHSPLMMRPYEKFKEFIFQNKFDYNFEPNMIILNNLNGEFYSTKEEILSNLSKQLISPVNWIKVIESLSKNVDCILEIGPGKTLTKFNKNILKQNKNNDIYLGHIENTETLDTEIRKIKYEINRVK